MAYLSGRVCSFICTDFIVPRHWSVQLSNDFLMPRQVHLKRPKKLTLAGHNRSDTNKNTHHGKFLLWLISTLLYLKALNDYTGDLCAEIRQISLMLRISLLHWKGKAKNNWFDKDVHYFWLLWAVITLKKWRSNVTVRLRLSNEHITRGCVICWQSHKTTTTRDKKWHDCPW